MIGVLLAWCCFSCIAMAIIIYRVARNNKHDELTIGPWQLFDHHTATFLQYTLITLLIVGAPLLLPAIILLAYMLPDPRK